MTPDEVQLLQHAGEVFLINLAQVITEAILYGVYVILSTIAIYSLWSLGLNTKSTRLPFLAFIAVLIAYTLNLTGRIAYATRFLRGGLVDNPHQAFRTRLNLANSAVLSWKNADLWLTGNNQGILFWAGDAIVVWRACIMFPHHTKIKHALVCSLVCGMALAISSLALTTLMDPSHNTIPTASPEAIMQITSSAIFILVNLAATAFIAQKTYEHRKLLKAGLGMSQSKSVKVMILLIESGTIYCCVQIVNALLSYFKFTPSGLKFTPSGLEILVYDVWRQLSIFASAIYPVAIILLVHHQKSIMDTPGLSEIIPKAGANIQFANTPPVRNATDSLFIDTIMDGAREDEDPETLSSEREEITDLEKGERLIRSCP